MAQVFLTVVFFDMVVLEQGIEGMPCQMVLWDRFFPFDNTGIDISFSGVIAECLKGKCICYLVISPGIFKPAEDEHIIGIERQFLQLIYVLIQIGCCDLIEVAGLFLIRMPGNAFLDRQGPVLRIIIFYLQICADRVSYQIRNPLLTYNLFQNVDSGPLSIEVHEAKSIYIFNLIEKDLLGL